MSIILLPDLEQALIPRRPPKLQQKACKLPPKNTQQIPRQSPSREKFELMRLPPELINQVIKEVIVADNVAKDWRTSFNLSETSKTLQRETYIGLRQNAIAIARAERRPWTAITFMKKVHDYRPALADFICEEFDAKDAWRRCRISVSSGSGTSSPGMSQSPRI